MNIRHIKEALIKGSEIYLEYLIQNDLGIERIPLEDLVQKDEKVYFLRLSKKLYDSCGFEIEVNGRKIYEEDFSVRNVTPGTKTLVVEFSEPFVNTLKRENVFVLVNMRFRVERVIKWYEKYGDTVTFPEALPKIRYIGNLSENTIPSPCQERAIKTVFSQPFSYIWGAPGTGKTKYVLANCVLNYLRYDEDEGIIFITAPTNAALDQSLSGILPILEKECFDLNKVARLGIATESLYSTYPSVCEKEIINRLSNEFNIVKEEMLTYIKRKEEMATANDVVKKMYQKLNSETEEKYGEISISAIEKLSKELAGARENLFHYLIKKDVRIIACTVDKFIAYKMNKLMEKNQRKASHLFLDEACYLSLIKAATLLSMDCPITFLGDHMQLPPVCEMDEGNFANPYFRPCVVWTQSAVYAEELFEKNIEEIYEGYMGGIPPKFDYLEKADLNETHRFGSGLCSILENYVYENHFSSLAEDETNIVVIDAKNNYTVKRESIGEAKAIEKLISEHSLRDYMVLTPYKNQESLIRKFTDRVMTVHRAQGQEWDTVILSVCDKENMYFTDSTNTHSKGLQLINTAISRAKKNLIVVCDCNFWRNCEGQLISAIVNYCE